MFVPRGKVCVYLCVVWVGFSVKLKQSKNTNQFKKRYKKVILSCYMVHERCWWHLVMWWNTKVLNKLLLLNLALIAITMYTERKINLLLVIHDLLLNWLKCIFECLYVYKLFFGFTCGFLKTFYLLFYYIFYITVSLQ